LLVLAFFCSGWALAAAAVHVVHTPGAISLLTKQSLGFSETYVDTRDWTGPEDLLSHPHLARRLVQLGRGELVNHALDLNDPHLVEALPPSRGATQASSSVPRVQVDFGW
jgi:hypothetical protein